MTNSCLWSKLWNFETHAVIFHINEKRVLHLCVLVVHHKKKVPATWQE